MKRSLKRRGYLSSQSESKRSRNLSRFATMTSEAGIDLAGQEREPVTLKNAPAKVKQELFRFFRREGMRNQAVADFCKGLEEYTDNSLQFRSCLLPCVAADGLSLAARTQRMDSLIRILLGVEYLQPKVVSLLVDKLSNSSIPEAFEELSEQEFFEMPRLILSQLQFLDFVIEGEDLCSKLLDVIDSVPEGIQRDIISCLPMALDDQNHEFAAKKLKEMLCSTMALTAPLLDALAQLQMSTEVEAEVLDVAVSRIPSANIEDVPVILMYIMEQAGSKTGAELISEVRDKLDTKSCFFHLELGPPVASSTPLPRHSKQGYIVLDVIRSSLKLKPVADGWMKAIEGVSEAEEHEVIDLFVLFSLYNNPMRRQAVKHLLQTKVRSQQFTEELLMGLLGAQTHALQSISSSVLMVAASMLCSDKRAIYSFGQALYRNVFCFLSSLRQEVVSALLSHIKTGVSADINNALETLTFLATHYCSEMRRFSHRLKSGLYCMEKLTNPQARTLYSLLSHLAIDRNDAWSGLQDELHSVVRKQLGHVEQKFRYMGVIGASQMLSHIARENPSDASQQSLPHYHERMGKELIHLAMTKCCSRGNELCLLFDEIAAVVRSEDIHEKIVKMLSDEISSNFLDLYVIETTDSLPCTHPQLQLELCHGLDPCEEGAIALNLVPVLMQEPQSGQESGLLIRCMCPHFRLLSVCEKKLNRGSMETIDALLGCPVVMHSLPEKCVFESLPLDLRRIACASLFHCINWFRELISAYSCEEDAEMKGKVLIRLQNINNLQGRLEDCLSVTSGPLPTVDISQEQAVARFQRRGRPSSKLDKSVANITTCADSTVTQQIDKTIVAAVASGSLEQINPFFRELDLDVFRCLSFENISCSLINSEMQNEHSEELSLSLSQLIFLLSDLLGKLACFSWFPPRGRSKVPSTAKRCTSLNELASAMADSILPALCSHLDHIMSFFQKQQESNDGVLDAGGEENDEWQLQLTSLLHILKAMYMFLSWPGLTDPLNEKWLVDVVTALASRASEGNGESLTEIANNALSYLIGLTPFLPTLPSAQYLSRLIVALSQAVNSKELKRRVAQVCGDLLKREWPSSEPKPQKNEVVEYLLKYHIEWSDKPLSVLEVIGGDAVTQLMGENPQEQSSLYPTLSLSTLPSYYRTMLAAVVTGIKSVPIPSKRKPVSMEKQYKQLEVLDLSARLLYMMVNLVKSFDSQSVLTAALKHGRYFLEAFLRSGIPVINALFRNKKEEVIALLKNLQRSTRCLQHFCLHSKFSKNTALTRHVPRLKKCLEAFLFSIKGVLSNHGALDSFWVGVLKNRDLQGQEILSQSVQSQQNSEQDSNEEEMETSDEENED